MKLKNAAFRGIVLTLACASAGCGSNGSLGVDPTNSPAAVSSTGSSEGTSPGSDGGYAVGGTVTGLTGTGLTLEINGSQTLALAADGTFSFPGLLPSGTSYAVTVKSQPSASREMCGVSNGSGTVGTAAVGTVAVACTTGLGFMYELNDSTNQIYSYGIEAQSGNVIPLGAPMGLGGGIPTSILTSADGRYIHVTYQTSVDLSTISPNSLTLSDLVGRIATFAVEPATGQLTLQGAPVPTAPYTTLSAATTSFLFVFNEYVSNLPHNSLDYPPPSLMEYALDPASGLPTLIGTPLTFPVANAFFAMAISPDQRYLYILSGDPSDNTPVWPTITPYAIDPGTGALTAGMSMTAQVNDNSIVIDPLGRFLYLETAGDFNPTGPASATILPYAIDPSTGALTAVGSGTLVSTNGSAIVIDPSGHYLYALNALNAGPTQNTIQTLSVDQSTGALSPMGPIIQTDGAGMDLMFDPSGTFMYLATSTQSNLDGQSTGTALTTFTISGAAESAGQLVPSGVPQQLPIGIGGWSIAIVE